MKKAFSLVELIVVIGILAILMGVLVTTMAGGSGAARAARCLTNLKNLATACNTYAGAHGSYPLAGSVEKREVSAYGDSSVSYSFTELKGWVSWNSRSAYPTTSHVASPGWFTSAYCVDKDERTFVMTNGAIWKVVSGNADVFVCPSHLKTLRNMSPLWSYAMNSKFGWDDSLGAAPKGNRYGGIEYGTLARADRVLLFSELQFLPNDKIDVKIESEPGMDCDCTLQYKHQEVIGFNHPSGKRTLCAHVAFADGHVEKISAPASISGKIWQIGVDKSNLEDLTKWLCEGKDVSYNSSSKKFEKLTN